MSMRALIQEVEQLVMTIGIIFNIVYSIVVEQHKFRILILQIQPVQELQYQMVLFLVLVYHLVDSQYHFIVIMKANPVFMM